jgi:hypothetical protein
MSDQDSYEFGEESAPVTGPGVIRDSETNRRVRPSASRLKSIPRSRRTAEIICDRTGREPALVAIVTGSRDGGRVVLSGDINGGRVGQDLVAPCRCGLDHVIGGDKLRSTLLALRGRATRINVASVERSGAGTDRLE